MTLAPFLCCEYGQRDVARWSERKWHQLRADWQGSPVQSLIQQVVT